MALSDLLERLDGLCDYTVTPDQTLIVVSSWNGRALSVPCRVLIDVAGFDAFAIDDETREALWPDASVSDASINLVLVHLEEAVATEAHAVGPLRLNSDGLRVPPSRLVSTERDPATDLRFYAPRSREEYPERRT